MTELLTIEAFVLVVTTLRDGGFSSITHAFTTPNECLLVLEQIKEAVSKVPPSEVLPYTAQCIRQVVELKFGA